MSKKTNFLPPLFWDTGDWVFYSTDGNNPWICQTKIPRHRLGSILFFYQPGWEKRN